MLWVLHFSWLVFFIDPVAGTRSEATDPFLDRFFLSRIYSHGRASECHLAVQHAA